MSTPLLRMKSLALLVPVGSRITCDPAPTNTDEDYIVLLNAATFSDVQQALRDDCWQYGGSIIDDEVNTVPREDRFASFRLDDVNLVTTWSGPFYDRFLAATSVAKRLNLLDKADRIALFQAVLYGNACSVPSTVEEIVF